MANAEDVQHNIFLVIVAGLFILFITGIAGPLRTPLTPIIVPSG